MITFFYKLSLYFLHYRVGLNFEVFTLMLKISLSPSFFTVSFSLNRVAVRKPVGILHVKVVRAIKLLKMDILGTSDPYVKLSLSGEKLPAKKTTIKKKNLNPEWNENFKLIVKDPQTQILNIKVYDWDKVCFLSLSKFP